MKRGKRYLQATQTLDKSKTHSIEEAIEILKKMPPVKFDQTVEVTCRLNVDPKKSDQMVRGSVVLPHGTGKKKKVLVFCEPEKEKEAQEAGADYVGGQELADKILKKIG